MNERFISAVVRRGARSASLVGLAALGGAWSLACGATDGGTSTSAASHDPAVAHTASASTERARVAQYLDSIYRLEDVRHTFRTAGGENVDCIDFEAQPSVQRARAQGIPVSNEPPPIALPPGAVTNARPLSGADQTPDEQGRTRQCPAGTVAFSGRPTYEQIEEKGGLDAYVRAIAIHKRGAAPAVQPDSVPAHTQPGPDWDHAAGFQYVNYTYFATTTPVFTPMLQNSGDHSVSQMWVLTGSCASDPFVGSCGTSACAPYTCSNANTQVQSLEVGWIVGSPNSDANPHLFVFTTTDGYGSSSCFAQSGCGSFVRMSAPYWPGAPLTSTNLGSTPVELSMAVVNYNQTWYIVADGSYIGYIPPNTYRGQMQSSASYFQVGGEVFDSWENNPPSHTITFMGSGISTWNYPAIAYHRNIQFVVPGGSGWTNAALTFQNGNGITGNNAATYYHVVHGNPGGTNWGSFFYFGGPF